jgi:Ca2+-binding RTX toxin-like protein
MPSAFKPFLLALSLLSLLPATALAAGTASVNSDGRMVYKGGSTANEITVDYDKERDDEYPWQVRDAKGEINVASGSSNCVEVGLVVRCKGVESESRIFLEGGNDTAQIEGVDALVRGDSGGDEIFATGAKIRVFGSEGNDDLTGGSAEVFLSGGADSDILKAEKGLTMKGDGGADYLVGSSAKDQMFGGTGPDTILGYGGRDQANGNADPDLMVFASGDKDSISCTEKDTVISSRGDLRIGCRSKVIKNRAQCQGTLWERLSEEGDNRLLSSGIDLARGWGGSDSLDGMTGNDCLFGDGDDDLLLGAKDHDLLFGGLGEDVLLGGSGRDYYETYGPITEKVSRDVVLASDGQKERIRCDQGDSVVADKDDRVLGSCIKVIVPKEICNLWAGVRTSDGGNEANAVQGTDKSESIRVFSGDDIVRGGEGLDCIWGDSGNDRIFGNGQRDQIWSGAGNDFVEGGRGRDKVWAGPGQDVVRGASGNDLVVARDGFRDRINCGPGRDKVYADGKDRVARSCEQVRRSG